MLASHGKYIFFSFKSFAHYVERFQQKNTTRCIENQKRQQENTVSCEAPARRTFLFRLAAGEASSLLCLLHSLFPVVGPTGRVGPAGAAWSRSCAATEAAPTGCAQPEPGLLGFQLCPLALHRAPVDELRGSYTAVRSTCGEIQGEPFLRIRGRVLGGCGIHLCKALHSFSFFKKASSLNSKAVCCACLKMMKLIFLYGFVSESLCVISW